MKYIYCIFSILLLANCSQKIKTDKTDLTNVIIGTWNFVETREPNGNKLESYERSFGTVQATGPKLIYKSDFTYNKVFTPKNTDVGNWKFNFQTMTIEHDLYIDSTDFIGKDLIKKKLAVKSTDGNYYERIEDKILKIEKEEMLIDNRGLIDVYKKEMKK